MEKYIRDEKTGMIINKDDVSYQNFIREKFNKKKFRELEEQLLLLSARIKRLEEKE